MKRERVAIHKRDQALLDKKLMYSRAEQVMVDILKDYFNNESLSEIDGRTMAAAFRRFDIIERYLKNETGKGRAHDTESCEGYTGRTSAL